MDATINGKINDLRYQISNGLNIGLSLIDLLDDQDTIKYIHIKAENILKNAANSYSATVSSGEDLVFISLCLIGLQHYDNGNFYDAVEEQYADLYSNFSKQKIDGIIRYVLSKFQRTSDHKKSRIINIALINSLVPKHYLPAFFDFVFDIYCLNFNREIPIDIKDELKFAFNGIRSLVNENSDGIKVSATKKTYKLIKTTKDILSNENLIDQLIELSANVVDIIDEWYWQEKIDLINSYYEFGFNNWEKPTERGNRQRSSTPNNSNHSAWKPEYKLYSGEVYLEFPAHKVKGDFEYSIICGQVINDEMVIQINEPNISKIVGGYRVEIEKLRLERPLGKITYNLMCGDTCIYSSKRELYRDYIVFDDNGNELDNNCDYEGDAFFCVIPGESPGTIIRNNKYGLSVKSHPGFD